MVKYFLGFAVIVAIVCGIFYGFWMPLPDEPARDAVGQQKSINVNDRTLSYYVSGEGRPIILLASAGREASDFNELVAELTGAGHRTIAIEAQGIKDSTLPTDEMSLFDMADDVKAVADVELDAGETVTILGHAFGNRVARAFASRNDALVNSIILVAAGGEKAIPEKANAALKAIFDPRHSVSQRKEDIATAFFAKGNDIPEHWVTGWHRHTAILQGKAKGQESYARWGAGGTKSMLILQATEDAIAPTEDAGALLAGRFPHRVRLVMIEQAGHALLPEQPAKIAEAITAFLKEQG